MTLCLLNAARPDYQQSLIALQSELNCQQSKDFINYCAARIGYSEAETQRIFNEEVLPYIALCQIGEIESISPPAVGTLVDLAAEQGPAKIQELASRCIEQDCESPNEYLDRYEATRAWLLAHQANLTSEIWPESNSIELADTKRYKGCSGSESSSWSSSSYSEPSSSSSSSSSYSSSSSSSSGDSAGSFMGLLILGVGYCLYNYPVATSAGLVVLALNLYLARWIWRWLNFALYAGVAGYGALLLATKYTPPDPWYLGAGIVAAAALVAGSIGLSIAQFRQNTVV